MLAEPGAERRFQAALDRREGRVIALEDQIAGGDPGARIAKAEPTAMAFRSAITRRLPGPSTIECRRAT